MVEERLSALGYERVGEVSQAQVVITYCTSQTALEDAYFDEEGIVQAATPGTLIVDLSAATPSFARELNAISVVSDLLPVEAPLVVADVTLEDAFADRENLMCLVAGEEKDIEAAQPILEALVGSVQVLGASGTAQLARASCTLQTSAQIMAAIEADALYRSVRSSSTSFGLFSERAGATSPESELMLQAVNEARFAGTYTVEMLMAELSAALMAADDVDLILPQAEACLHLLELLAVIGGADKAPAALALVYGEEAACAENGLDWTRAEQAYAKDDDEYDDEYDDCGDDCGHDHGGYAPGFGAYSAN